MRKITCAVALSGLLALGCVPGAQLPIDTPKASESRLPSFDRSPSFQALRTALTVLLRASAHASPGGATRPGQSGT